MVNLFISPLFEGSTSLMRLNAMKSILPNECIIDTIDTQKIIDCHSRISRVLAYRFKLGSVSWAINKKIKNEVKHKSYDIIWVEKGVLIKPSVVRMLKSKSNTLIHFTPDPAFLFHKSNKFLNSINYYDFLITTKSKELEYYHEKAGNKKVILSRQGYCDNKQVCYNSFNHRIDELIFIGYHTQKRENTLKSISEILNVNIVGKGWRKRKILKQPSVKYLAEKAYGKEYTRLLNKYRFSVGFLSSWDKDMHTTRTFEIPACGCILITPDNQEIRSFYTEDEAVFYADDMDLKNKLKEIFNNTNLAEQIARKGNQRTVSGNNSHSNIMAEILEKVKNV